MQGEELHDEHGSGGIPNRLSLIVYKCLRCRLGGKGSGETVWAFITLSQRLDWLPYVQQCNRLSEKTLFALSQSNC